MRICRRVWYAGRVQGVGFRYQTLRIAQDHAVAGQVKNLADGRVELVAEGEAAEVERFLDATQRTMDGYIDAVESRDEAEQGFADFRIGY